MIGRRSAAWLCVLLAHFGERYVGLHGNAHRSDLLTQRLTRMRGRADGSRSQPGSSPNPR